MNKNVHAISRDFVRVIEDAKWPNDEAKDTVYKYMHDYIDSLVIDLEERGLPADLTVRILVRAALAINVCYEGRLEAAKSIAAAMIELISDENLPA